MPLTPGREGTAGLEQALARPWRPWRTNSKGCCCLCSSFLFFLALSCLRVHHCSSLPPRNDHQVRTYIHTVRRGVLQRLSPFVAFTRALATQRTPPGVAKISTSFLKRILLVGPSPCFLGGCKRNFQPDRNQEFSSSRIRCICIYMYM